MGYQPEPALTGPQELSMARLAGASWFRRHQGLVNWFVAFAALVAILWLALGFAATVSWWLDDGCFQRHDTDTYQILRDRAGNDRIVAIGDTPQEAWANADFTPCREYRP